MIHRFNYRRSIINAIVFILVCLAVLYGFLTVVLGIELFR